MTEVTKDMSLEDLPEYLSLKEVGVFYDISYATVRSMISRGELPSTVVAQKTVVKREFLRNFKVERYWLPGVPPKKQKCIFVPREPRELKEPEELKTLWEENNG